MVGSEQARTCVDTPINSNGFETAAGVKGLSSTQFVPLKRKLIT